MIGWGDAWHVDVGSDLAWYGNIHLLTWRGRDGCAVARLRLFGRGLEKWIY